MILVTGASGHLGTTLVQELLDRGKTVRAMYLPGERAPGLDGLTIERVEGDVLDPESVRGAVSGVDMVFHLAGIIGIRPGIEALMERVNVDGTRNVALASREEGVHRFVYVSSIHAFTRPEAGDSIDEALGFDPENPAGAYDRSKAKATLEVLRLVETGLRAVVVCPTGIIGPNDFKNSEMGHTISTWMRPRRHLMIDGRFDFVDVRDVANGIIAAGESGRVGEAYILPGTQVSLKALHDEVQRAAGLRRKPVMVPWRLALAWIKTLAPLNRLRRNRSPLTSYSIETVRSNSKVTSTKARRELGYRTRSIVTTIRDTVAWWRARNGAEQSGIRSRWLSGFRDRTALVTGASTGIGEAVALALGNAGLKVILVSRNGERLDRVARSIEEQGGRAEAAVCDLARPGDRRSLFDRIEAMPGGIDVLVNNAGLGWYGEFRRMSDESIFEMIEVNNAALVALTHRVLPGMQSRGLGRIINIGSIAGMLAPQGTVIYAATKAFVNAFSRALGRELAGTGVTVSVVRPGPVATEFFSKARVASGHRRVPAERLGISPAVVARRVIGMLRGRRRVGYVPGFLAVLPLLLLLTGWMLDLAGPIHLRRGAKT